jgi:hypothetical protein
MPLLRKLWEDDCGGGLLSAELLFLYSTLVLGTVSGLVAMRQALLSELTESAQSVLALNQSFSLSGQSSCQSSTAGSSASDSSNTIQLGSLAGSGGLVSQTPMD